MPLWSSIPRGVRQKAERLLPEWWWVWLHQLREVEQDRRYMAGGLLLQAYPSLASRADGQTAFNRAECRVYSQNGEDGILVYLLSLIGATNRTFIEFGIGDGSECNTANLSITFGWRGLLMDADPAMVARAQKFYASRPTTRSSGLEIVRCVVEPDNINHVLLENGVQGEIDLLSIDIDGNDYWVWRALTAVDPRVVVIEYNASYGPDRSVTVPYRAGFDRYAFDRSGFYHGASLRALTKLAMGKGYVLAGCDSRGTNAFYVRADVAEGKIPAVSVAEAFFPLLERQHLTLDEQFRQIEYLEFVAV